jgi:hypothetical protein
MKGVCINDFLDQRGGSRTMPFMSSGPRADGVLTGGCQAAADGEIYNAAPDCILEGTLALDGGNTFISNFVGLWHGCHHNLFSLIVDFKTSFQG